MSRYYYLIPESKKADLGDFEAQIRTWYKARPFNSISHFNPEDYLIVYGGDGALNYALNALSGRDLPQFLYIPGGTANDFARSLYESPYHSPIEWVEQSVQGVCRTLPIIRCNDRYFINVASGLNLAEITPQVSSESKARLGRVSYYIEGLTKLTQLKVYSARLSTDSNETSRSLLGFVVASGRYAGGGLKVKSEEKISNREFEVLLVGENTPGELLDLLVRLQSEEEDLTGLRAWRHKARELKLQFERPVQVTLDGESYESDRFHFQLIPRALHLVMPREQEQLI